MNYINVLTVEQIDDNANETTKNIIKASNNFNILVDIMGESLVADFINYLQFWKPDEEELSDITNLDKNSLHTLLQFNDSYDANWFNELVKLSGESTGIDFLKKYFDRPDEEDFACVFENKDQYALHVWPGLSIYYTIEEVEVI